MDEFEGDSSLLYLDLVIDVAFLIEVCLRFTFAPSHVLFFFNFYNLVDACSVLPLVLTVIIDPKRLIGETRDDTGAWKILSFAIVIRLPLRLLRVSRRFFGIRLLMHTLSVALEAMPLALFMFSLLVLTAGSLLYLVEGKVNPDLNSIPKAIYFSIVTVSTAGFGDVVPITTVGKIVVCILMIGGVLYMAIPIWIVGTTFSSIWKERDILLIRTKFLGWFESWRHRRDSKGRRSGIFGGRDSGMTRIFARICPDGSPTITKAAFLAFLKDLGIDIPLQRAQKVFDDYDTDGSGLLSRSEFSALVFPSSDMIREDGNDDADDVSEGSDGKADASVALQDLSLQHQNIQTDLDAINELNGVNQSKWWYPLTRSEIRLI